MLSSAFVSFAVDTESCSILPFDCPAKGEAYIIAKTRAEHNSRTFLMRTPKVDCDSFHQIDYAAQGFLVAVCLEEEFLCVNHGQAWAGDGQFPQVGKPSIESGSFGRISRTEAPPGNSGSVSVKESKFKLTHYRLVSLFEQEGSVC